VVACGLRSAKTADKKLVGKFFEIEIYFQKQAKSSNACGREKKYAGRKAGGCIGHIDVPSTFAIDVYT
jgi:hypothetical protein